MTTVWKGMKMNKDWVLHWAIQDAVQAIQMVGFAAFLAALMSELRKRGGTNVLH